VLSNPDPDRARPESRVTYRVAFATSPTDVVGSDDIDRPHHEAACTDVGMELDYLVWSDPDVEWETYDLVVLRSTWDYLDHLDQFRAWLDRVGVLGTLENAAPVVAWNLDKHYLIDLAAAGVPVIPTAVCDDEESVAVALGALFGEVVVKPSISAGSRLTGRFAAGSPEAGVLASLILAEGNSVLVQPAVASVALVGEVSTVLFAGQISHSVRKGPLLALGGGLTSGVYAEELTPEPLTPVRQALVESAMVAVARLVRDRFGIIEPMLYARVDVVAMDDGSEVVLEVELAEPAFFLPIASDAAKRFAAEVVRRATLRSGPNSIGRSRTP